MTQARNFYFSCFLPRTIGRQCHSPLLPWAQGQLFHFCFHWGSSPKQGLALSFRRPETHLLPSGGWESSALSPLGLCSVDIHLCPWPYPPCLHWPVPVLAVLIVFLLVSSISETSFFQTLLYIILFNIFMGRGWRMVSHQPTLPGTKSVPFSF